MPLAPSSPLCLEERPALLDMKHKCRTFSELLRAEVPPLVYHRLSLCLCRVPLLPCTHEHTAVTSQSDAGILEEGSSADEEQPSQSRSQSGEAESSGATGSSASSEDDDVPSEDDDGSVSGLIAEESLPPDNADEEVEDREWTTAELLKAAVIGPPHQVVADTAVTDAHEWLLTEHEQIRRTEATDVGDAVLAELTAIAAEVRSAWCERQGMMSLRAALTCFHEHGGVAVLRGYRHATAMQACRLQHLWVQQVNAIGQCLAAEHPQLPHDAAERRAAVAAAVARCARSSAQGAARIPTPRHHRRQLVPSARARTVPPLTFGKPRLPSNALRCDHVQSSTQDRTVRFTGSFVNIYRLQNLTGAHPGTHQSRTHHLGTCARVARGAPVRPVGADWQHQLQV